MIKTIIFDIGNVLISSNQKKICKELAKNSELSADEIYNVIFNGDLIKKYDKGKISKEEFLKESYNRIKTNIPFKKLDLNWEDTYKPIKSVNELVLKIKKGGYRLLVLSNVDKYHFDFVKRKFSNLLKPFNEFVLSYKIGYRKPERRIFQEAIKLSKCNPKEIVYIDDIKEYTNAADKLGINGIHFQNISKLKKDLVKLGVKI
ncbi:HAD family phosphatase [Candidatus Woesearchaeota archaeon]|nr:HAD family phosphatase [Candidatus Woesearchaeota archaeon]